MGRRRHRLPGPARRVRRRADGGPRGPRRRPRRPLTPRRRAGLLPVGLWGYSGGALASGWAAELAPTYAPELPIAGVAAGGIPADFAPAARIMDGGPFSGLALAGITGLMREYPELEPLLNDTGRAMVARVGDMCVAELAITLAFKRIADHTDSPTRSTSPSPGKCWRSTGWARPRPPRPSTSTTRCSTS
ncbi:lipase family protein [Actinokineospora soli]|uniref:Lipase family protein n=1 Tax=Actinokineospora soli TaxID=1048753 RepID=A0ABW2TNG0_9PSEU